MAEGYEILVVGALLAAGLIASLLAERMRVPALLLFLFVGMVLGSDATGLIAFSNYHLAQEIGVVALALILFEGGLTSGLLEIRPVLASAVSLAVVGTAVTAIVVGLAAVWLLDLSTIDGLLVGAIVSATDGAAIFGLLRSSSLRRRLARTLEGESGFNDPMAILLVLGFIALAQEPGFGALDFVELFVRQIGIGLVVGTGLGLLAVRALGRMRLASTGLYPVASLCLAALAFGAADALDGSGFLAVYLAGLILGTASVPAKLTITVFHEGLAWIAQVVMFLTLGLLVFPAQLPGVALEGTILALVIVFVARPAAVLVALPVRAWKMRERVVLTAAGLRGAVPVVLATFPVVAGVQGSEGFFNLAFFAVVVSVLVQGLSFEPIARRLGATSQESIMPRPLSEAGTIRGLGAEVLEYRIAEADAIVGGRVRDLGLPREAVVSVVVREEDAIPPRGSTRLRAGDRLHVLLRRESSAEVQALLKRWATGPIGPRRRPRPAVGRVPIFKVGRPDDVGMDGEPARPRSVGGQGVTDRLRVRRDVPGALVTLEDGRYAVTGPSLVFVGSRDQLTGYARRRAGRLERDTDERAWLQTVTGALAADEAEHAPPRVVRPLEPPPVRGSDPLSGPE